MTEPQGYARLHAPFACDPAQSRGRLHPEPASLTRSNFRRDCDRIIHTTAFRRLKHKTQVFIVHEGDHYRTRLTHTLEVTQIARALSRALRLDEDLAEALALAHDLGHPPFGHAGERALQAALRAHGGFDHNVQTLRILTALERRYPRFEGLNLSWETLEGVIKHNGPLIDSGGVPLGHDKDTGVPAAIAAYAAAHGIPLDGFASAEAQAAALADDIAYDAHDIDDGIRAGFFALDEIAEVPKLGAILAAMAQDFPGLDAEIRVHEFIRRLIGEMIEDVIAETARRVAANAPQSADAVRRASGPTVAFSAGMAQTDKEIKGFLYPRMYRHPRIMRVIRQAEAVVSDLYLHYSGHPETLPVGWLVHPGSPGPERRARRISDFIAGMTDSYALLEHARYFDTTPELR